MPWVVLKYADGECNVLGPFDTEEKGYEYIGRVKNGDRLDKGSHLFVRLLEKIEEEE